MTTSFFDFLNSINDTKVDLIADDPANEANYVPFMVNRGLSYFADTVLYANEMNQHASIPKKWQFDFLRTAVPKKRRFSKWHKKDQNPEAIQLIMKEYDYSAQKAAQIADLLSDEQINSLKEKYSTGGR